MESTIALLYFFVGGLVVSIRGYRYTQGTLPHKFWLSAKHPLNRRMGISYMLVGIAYLVLGLGLFIYVITATSQLLWFFLIPEILFLVVAFVTLIKTERTIRKNKANLYASLQRGD